MPPEDAKPGTGAPDNANAGGQQGGGQGDQPFAVFPDEKSFMSRVGREAKKQLETRAKELGFDTVEAMEAALKAARDKADAEKTELQKAQERAQAAEIAKVQALEAANQRLIRAEVFLKATELGAVDPDAAFTLMDRSAVRVGEDGTVEGVAEAMKALLEAKPYLKRAGGQPVPGAGATNPPPAEGDLAAQIREAEAKGNWREAARLKLQQFAAKIK